MLLGPKRSSSRRVVAVSPRRVLLKQLAIGFGLFVLIGLIVTGIWYGTRLTALTISTVDVVGGETIPHEVIRDIAEIHLDGVYLHLIPHRFAWLYPHDLIADAILRTERVKHVRVERSSGTVLAVAFEEYRPFALWCPGIDSNECFFLDREGYSFASAPRLDGGAFLRFSIDGVSPEANTQPFEATFIRDMTTFVSRVYDELGFNIIEVTKVAEDELVYHVAGGGQIKVSLRMSHDETYENLVTLLRSEQFGHLSPGHFAYIDLRYGNKVFVHEGVDDTASTTDSQDDSAI